MVSKHVPEYHKYSVKQSVMQTGRVAQLLTGIATGAAVPSPSRSNRAQCRQQLTIAVTFLWSCVVQSLSRRNGSRHSLRALRQYREYNEDLIILNFRL